MNWGQELNFLISPKEEIDVGAEITRMREEANTGGIRSSDINSDGDVSRRDEFISKKEDNRRVSGGNGSGDGDGLGYFENGGNRSTNNAGSNGNKSVKEFWS